MIVIFPSLEFFDEMWLIYSKVVCVYVKIHIENKMFFLFALSEVMQMQWKNCVITRSILFALLVCMGCTSIVHANVSGASAMNFLKIPSDVRGVAMGETGTALGDGIGSLEWNPAGIANISDVQATWAYNKWFQDMSSQYAAAAVPWYHKTPSGVKKHYGTYAVSVNYFSVTPFQGYDAKGSPTSFVGSSDMAAGLSYGTHITRALSYGMTVKYLHETLDNVSATAYAADEGILFRTPAGFSMGLAVENIGTQVKFMKDSGTLPQTLRAGVAYQHFLNSELLTLTCDAIQPNDRDYTYFGTGVEYWVKQTLAVRSGYRTGIDEGSGLRVGLGIKISPVELNYAFAGFGDLGLTHRVGMTMRFGDITNSHQAQVCIDKAKKYCADQQYAPAITQLNKALSIEPNNKEALEMMKACYTTLLGEKK